MVEACSQRVLIDRSFSLPMCVRLARMNYHAHRLLSKMLGAVPGDRREVSSELWGGGGALEFGTKRTIATSRGKTRSGRQVVPKPWTRMTSRLQR